MNSIINLRTGLYLFIIMLVFLAGCDSNPPSSEQLSPERSTVVRRALVAWLECEECDGNELPNVVTLKRDALPMLIPTLNEGPSPAKREVFLAGLEMNFDKLVEYSKTHPESMIKMNKEEYLNTYLQNYVAKYQSRAAIALAEIGGKEAKAALKRSLRLNLRDDVKTVVRESLKKMKSQEIKK